MKDTMTFEEALQDETLSHFHEAIHFMEKNKDKIFFPKRFMQSLKHVATQELMKLYIESPNMPLLNVVITTLTGMNDKLTPEMIVEITTHITEEWERLKQAKQLIINELQPA